MFLELKNNHILFWNNLILFTFWSKIFRRDKVQRLLRKKIETRKNSIRGYCFCLKENWKTFLRKLNISQWNLFGWYPLRYKLLLPLNSVHLSIFLSIMHKWWAALIVCNNPSFATTQPSCKTVIHASAVSFLTFSTEHFSDDSRGLFDGLRCEKIVGIAPGFGVDLGFKPRISAFKSRSKQSGAKCSEHNLDFFETSRSACEIFASHCDHRGSSLGKQW